MIQLSATDADDPTYGNSARVVYSILEGQPYFSVDAKTGETGTCFTFFFPTRTEMWRRHCAALRDEMNHC